MNRDELIEYYRLEDSMFDDADRKVSEFLKDHEYEQRTCYIVRSYQDYFNVLLDHYELSCGHEVVSDNYPVFCEVCGAKRVPRDTKYVLTLDDIKNIYLDGSFDGRDDDDSSAERYYDPDSEWLKEREHHTCSCTSMGGDLKPCPFCGSPDGKHKKDCWVNLVLNEGVTGSILVDAWNKRAGEIE